MKVGLDVGGTKTDAVAVDGDGEIVGRVRLVTGWGSDAVTATVLAAVSALGTDAGVDVSAVRSVGIGIPGQIEPGTGRVVHAVNLGVDELDLDDLLGTQAFLQEFWSDNAVSFTCNIDPDMSPFELEQALIQYLPQLKGTTIFPDLSRPQSPFERIPDGVYEVIGEVMGAHDEVGQAIEDCIGACPVR